MNTNGDKIVDFEKWCASCKNADKPEVDDKCAECLDYSVNQYSTKPVNWEENK